MTDTTNIALIRLSNAAWQLARQATNAARWEGLPREELIRCMAETNVAADKLRRELGISCDEIADVEAELMEDDEDV